MMPRSAAATWLELIEHLAVCHRELQTTLAAAISRRGMGVAEFMVLWSCPSSGEPGVSQSELAQRQGVSAAQMSGLAEGLRARGWLVSHRDPTDRRRQFWCTTHEGQAVVSTAMDDIGELAASLNAADAAAVIAMLRRLQASRAATAPAAMNPERRGAA